MSCAAYLKPRKEAISEEGIEGIIDLANLQDTTKTRIESRPDDFFKLTYPTPKVARTRPTDLLRRNGRENFFQ